MIQRIMKWFKRKKPILYFDNKRGWVLSNLF